MIQILDCLILDSDNKHQDSLISCITGFSKKYFADVQNIFFALPIDNIELNFVSNMKKGFSKESISAISPIPQCSKSQNITKVITINRTYLNKEDIEMNEHNDKFVLYGTTNFNNTSAGEFENLLLQRLNQESQWSFFVALGNNNINNQLNLESFHGYILILKKEEQNKNSIISSFRNQIQVLLLNRFFNHWAAFLVVIVGTSESNEIQKTSLDLFQALTSSNVKNSMIAYQDTSGVVTVLTGFPYDPLSEVCSEMLNISVYATCKSHEKGNYDISYVKLTQINKFNATYQCPVKLSVIKNNLPVSFITFPNEMDRYNISAYNGILAKFLILIFSHMKKPIKIVPNSNFDIYNENLCQLTQLQARQEFIYYYILSYSWFVPKAQKQSRWTSIFKVFSKYTWICGSFSVLLCIVMFQILTSIHLRKYWYCSDIGKCGLDAWSILLGISICELPNKLSIRLFLISWIVYSFAINMVFQTYVTSYFVDPGFEYQIHTLQEIFDKNYELTFDNFINMINILFKVDNDIKLHNTLETIDSVILFLNKTKMAMMICDDVFISKTFQDCRNELTNVVYRIKQDQIQHFHALIIVNPFLVENVKRIVSHIIDSGILHKLTRDAYGNNAYERAWNIWDLREEYIPISINHLQSAVLLYFFGVCVGFVSFLIEIGIKKLKK